MAASSAAESTAHMLRLVLTCRKITAEVMIPRTGAIVAMASSGEQEFVQQHRARLFSRFPRSRSIWDARDAARVGEKLGLRLRGAGVDVVEVDLDLELSRPPHYRRPLASLFLSVQQAGVRVAGADKLKWP
ncbi:uncharacterized protein LOC120259250 [Dioscorea cayenensis subsp. rotundata]|uniref:Uncharacterized protein LOC120259250 n=1 Tax=Dioscorea cayennensis subsp. rotundata TaxID=55577 RepID=A0AB40B7L3_DIOCR|nr:uncharacterized protein LOC120259250 [Dioscorea cayenensis subsp. rotundata]